MKLIYNISVSIYHFSVFIASFFNPKAKKWIDGRKGIFGRMEEAFRFSGIENPIKNTSQNPSKLIWFHCASLGEFEQGRPLMEKFKNKNSLSPAGGESKFKILVTFFSPSGYEIKKNTPLADYVFYLPADSRRNAEKFISIANPSVAIFVKYEIWFHYLNELNRRNIPAYLISANFRNDHRFFKWYGGWFQKTLKMFEHIFVQNESSENLLKKSGFKNVSISGDTRFDRVYETAMQAEKIPLIEKFAANSRVLIAGSTWEEDENAIAGLQFTRYKLKLIIAPHEIHENRINAIIKKFGSYKSLRFSQANENNIMETEVLIIDNIGLLSRLYRYGDIAYVGGAFGRSLHNILEAAAFGLPVIFGPDYGKNWEAAALIEKGGAFSINRAEELDNKINFLLQDEMILKIASEMSRNFVRSNTGATEKIMAGINKDN